MGVARTGNVPEATAHGKLVEQFAAPRHEHAAHLATNAANATNAGDTNAGDTNAGNQVKTSHADPIQNEVMNEVMNEVINEVINEVMNEVTQNKTKKKPKKTKKNEKSEKYYFLVKQLHCI